MTFVCLEFAVLLGVSLILVRALPRFRTAVLLLASYVFYAYWNPWYALLIAFSTAIDYGAARWIAAHDRPRDRRLALWISVAANLGMLGYFKYTNFGLHIIHDLLGEAASPLPSALDLILPVGISFYTFQSMAYTIDVYRGRIAPERNPAVFALFVSFFPQLVAGPIERADHLLPQLRVPAPSDSGHFEEGLRLLLWGLVKKLVVADRLVLAAMPVFETAPTRGAADLLYAALALFTMLYFDFSAYTDMARGTAVLFGVRLSENFRLPLAATSIAAFWRGWHITLSTWVRDYVFLPLGGTNPRNLPRQALVTLLTMGLVGLWHGANWTYVAWGLLHGVFMVIYLLWFMGIRRRFRRASRIARHPAGAFTGWALTMALHAVGMALFFSPDLSQAFHILRSFVSPTAWMAPPREPLGAGFAILIVLWLIHARMGTRFPLERIGDQSVVWRALFYAGLLLALALFAVPRSHTFVYFQF